LLSENKDNSIVILLKPKMNNESGCICIATGDGLEGAGSAAGGELVVFTI